MADRPPPRRAPGASNGAPLPRRQAAPSTPHEMQENLVANVGEDPDVWLAELESKVGELADARKDLAIHTAQMAQLESEYGSIGTLPSVWDHERKALLSRLMEDRRIEMQKELTEYAKLSKQEKAEVLAPPKITEAGLDSWAHSRTEYIEFVSRAKKERKDYEKMRAKRDEMWAHVHYLQGMISYLEQRIRMVEEKIRYTRTIAGLSR